MKYKVGCEVYVGSDYEIEANSAKEAEEIAYDMFIKDYGLKDNLLFLGFDVVKDVEEIEE